MVPSQDQGELVRLERLEDLGGGQGTIVLRRQGGPASRVWRVQGSVAHGFSARVQHTGPAHASWASVAGALASQRRARV